MGKRVQKLSKVELYSSGISMLQCCSSTWATTLRHLSKDLVAPEQGPCGTWARTLRHLSKDPAAPEQGPCGTLSRTSLGSELHICKPVSYIFILDKLSAHQFIIVLRLIFWNLCELSHQKSNDCKWCTLMIFNNCALWTLMFNSVFWVLIRMSCFLFENINCIHIYNKHRKNCECCPLSLLIVR